MVTKEKNTNDDLIKVLSLIDNSEDIEALLDDLFTYREIKDASSRLKVAKMLNDGISYLDIEKETRISATTIARVSKCLTHGSGGYKKALDILG